MKKIFIVVNEDRFFLSHRKEIGVEALSRGYDVTVVSRDCGNFESIQQLGIKTLNLPINPSGMNLREEFKTFKFLSNLYRKEKPDIVHHVGLKNILWGGLAAKIFKIHGVVNAVSGLGALFNDEKLTPITKGILTIMRYSNNRNNVNVIFQNNEDKTLFFRENVVKPNQISFIKGSGIDLNIFGYKPEPDDKKIQVIFTARMVKEKGVSDLIEAAHIIKDEMHNKVKFVLCGRTTENSNAISREYLDKMCDGEYIEYLGERKDIKELLENSHIMAFPSYYREGVPKSLIEASAIGRPIITCNSTGCKDVVEDGINGILVEPRNPLMLADALRTLINNKDLRRQMGLNSRKKAEREFSLKSVVEKHMQIYNNLSFQE